MALAFDAVPGDFRARLGPLDPDSVSCVQDAWDGFMAHIHVPLIWPSPVSPEPEDDTWDITSSWVDDPTFDRGRTVVQLQRRIGRYTEDGDYAGTAIVSCILAFAHDERWSAVGHLMFGTPAATVASKALIDAERRQVEQTPAFSLMLGARPVAATLSISGFPS
jgi:hypothetical protein